MKKNILAETVIFFVIYLCFNLYFEGLSIGTIATSFIASIIFLLVIYALNWVSKKKNRLP